MSRLTGMPETLEGVSDALLEAMEQWLVDDNRDIMLKFRNQAFNTGDISYALVYIYLLFKLLMFIIYYFKRFLTIIFLIVLFPFVTISYAVDKIKDGKAQIFNNWFKELLLNIFSQFFQAAIYMIVMGIIGGMISDASGNVVLFCVGIQFVSKSDSLIRALFPTLLGGGGAETVSPLSQLTDTAIAVSSAQSLLNKGKKVTAALKKGNETRKQKKKASDELSIHRSNQKIADYEQQKQNKKLGAPSAAGATGGAGGGGGSGGGGGGGTPPPSGPNPDAYESQNDAIRRALEGTAAQAKHKPGETDKEKDRREAKARKTRFENFQTMAALCAMPETRDRAREALKAHRGGLSDDEKKRFDANMKMAVHTQRALTGLSEDGTRLTQRQIQASFSVVADLVGKAVASGEDSPYSDIKSEYLKKGKKVKYTLRTPKKGYESAASRRSMIAKGGNPYDETQKEASFKDYFGVGGIGAKGKVLSDDESRQMQAGSKMLGGRDGLCSEKSVTAASSEVGEAKDDEFFSDVFDYNENGRVQEGKTVGVSDTKRLSDDEMRTALSDGEEDPAKARQVIADKKQQMIDAQGDVKKKDKPALDEAAELLLQLGQYTTMAESGDAISSDEMFRITDRLARLSDENLAVATMVSQSVSSSEPAAGESAVVHNSDGTMNINLGISLQGMRVMSAKTMLTDSHVHSDERGKKVKDGNDKKALYTLAEEVLQEEYEGYEAGDTIDAVAGAIVGRAELDEVFTNDGEEYFNEDLKGIHRSKKTVEEMSRERHDAEIRAKTVERQARYEAEAKLVRERNQAALERLSAVVDETFGNAVRISTTTTAMGLQVGASGEMNVSQILAGTDLGSRIGESIANIPQVGLQGMEKLGKNSKGSSRKKSNETDAQAAEYVRRAMINDVMKKLNDRLT